MDSSPSLDTCIATLLKPLVKSQVKLHYPLYANSFPLAYYYAKVIGDDEKKADLEKFVVQREWTKKIVDDTELACSPCHLFFGDDSTDKYMRSGYGVKQIAFTKYYPKFIFTDYTSRMVHFLHESGLMAETFDQRIDFANDDFADEKSIRPFTDLLKLDVIGKLNIKKIIIYTDTKPEAKKIADDFLEPILKNIEIIEVDKKEDDSGSVNDSTEKEDIVHDFSENPRSILKLYFFSGSYNMYFLKDLYNYIPFQFRKSEVGDGFMTYNYLMYKEGTSDVEIEKITDGVARFHQLIFSEAQHYPENLSNLFYSFKELLKIKQPFKVFEDVHTYSKCIVFHNMDKPDKVRVEDIWGKLFVMGGKGNYAQDLDALRSRVRRVYSLLTLDHLYKNYNLVGMESNDFKGVLNLLKDSLMNDGRYLVYFRDYIKAEIVGVIAKYEKIDDSHISAAIAAGKSKDGVLHNMLHRIWGYFFEEDYKHIILSEIITAKNENFDFKNCLSEIVGKLSGDCSYVNTSVLKKSIAIIDTMFKDLILYFSEYKELPHTFFGEGFLNPTVSKAIASLTPRRSRLASSPSEEMKPIAKKKK
jgi:hypothetical protein